MPTVITFRLEEVTQDLLVYLRNGKNLKNVWRSERSLSEGWVVDRAIRQRRYLSVTG